MNTSSAPQNPQPNYSARVTFPAQWCGRLNYLAIVIRRRERLASLQRETRLIGVVRPRDCLDIETKLAEMGGGKRMPLFFCFIHYFVSIVLFFFLLLFSIRRDVIRRLLQQSLCFVDEKRQELLDYRVH